MLSYRERNLRAVLTLELVGHVALAAVVTVEVSGHKHSSTTLRRRALLLQTLDLAIVVHLVVLEHAEFHLLVLVFDLLGLRVHFFFLRFLPPPRRRSTRCSVDSFWML